LDEQTYAKLYAYVHIIIYQLCLKIEIWFTSDHTAITGVDPGFQVRGGALKKIAPSRERRENLRK
jgi:hypothetical protein